jgi:predicted glycogen debranching enzyme
METLDLSALSLDAQLSREWLAVNHLGGYAASSVPGCNTRKYHGLLVAAMSPPVIRMVLLSRVEETVFYDGWPHALACNEYPDAMHPQGHRMLRAFSNEPFPRWAYQNEGWTLEKQLRLLKGENTVVLSYTLMGSAKPIELEVRPLFALRGIHELMYQWNAPLTPQSLSPSHHHIPATHATPEAFLAHDGKFVGEGYWYLNTIYRREQERGYSGLEDLWSPGVVRFTLAPGQTAHFVCSTDPIELPRVLAEAARQFAVSIVPAVAGEPADASLEALCRAAEQFVVTNRDGRATLMSGYPWSAPSGRDAMIDLPGLLLVTGKLTTARAVLEYFASLVKDGLMPSEFPIDGGAPKYRGADVSLWFINSLREYLRYSGDEKTVERLFDAVDGILSAYEKGTHLGVRADAEGLLLSGSGGIGATWMNAEIGDTAVTPRQGRAVEVNALWYNALRIGADFAKRFHHPVRSEELFTLANRARAAFNRRFWNDQTGCCFDVVADSASDGAIRPNQLLAISLPYPILNIERHAAVLSKVRDELLTPFGLRTLSSKDPNYQGRYVGPIQSRDRAYHQGSAYPWLLGPFVSAFVRVYGRGATTREQALAMLRPGLEHLRGRGGGQIHELFDGDAPHHPGGLTACARSVAEVLRAYVEDVLDLGPVDVTRQGGSSTATPTAAVATSSEAARAK